jgi:hypothetical protein
MPYTYGQVVHPHRAPCRWGAGSRGQGEGLLSMTRRLPLGYQRAHGPARLGSRGLTQYENAEGDPNIRKEPRAEAARRVEHRARADADQVCNHFIA